MIRYIQFYPTLRCNMSCSFCFNRGIAGMEDADPVDFKKIVSVAAGLGIGHIDFLGGEPTLHPHIADMIAAVASAGLMTTLSSNGTRPEILEELSNRFSGACFRVGISINTESIGKNLRAYIKRYNPIIKTLYDPAIPENNLFLGLETEGVDFRLIYPDIVSDSDIACRVPFYNFYNRLNRIRSSRPEIAGVYCQGFLPDSDSPGLDAVRCPAGTTKLAVLPDGSVYPCYLLFRYKQFRLGSFLEDDFKSIWSHPLLDAFRFFDKNRCPRSSCDLFSQCHGGCPAISYMFSGNLSGPDPRCISVSQHQACLVPPEEKDKV